MHAAIDMQTNSLARKLGFWAAVTACLTVVTYTVCFVGILLSGPVFMWTSLADYVAYVEQNGGSFQPLAKCAMLPFGLSFVVLLNCVHEQVRGERRVLTRIALVSACSSLARSGCVIPLR